MMGFAIWVLPIVLFVFWAVRFRNAHIKAQDSVSNAIQIHKDKLAELAAQFEQGQMSSEEYDALKLEEEKALLADADRVQSQPKQQARLPWLWVPLFSVVIFAAAYLTYSIIGSAEAVSVKTKFDALRAAGSNLQPEQINETLSSYQTLLKKHPSDLDGWFRLSRMQMDLQQFEQAVESFQHVLSEVRKVEHRAEDEATVLSYMGQAYLALQKYPEAMAAFEESLQYSQSDTALGLAGRIAFELADYRKAIDYWTRLKLRNPDTDSSPVDELIGRAKKQLAAQGIDYEAEQPLHIIAHIEMPTAWEGLPEEAALFVYARQPGQRMPLVVKRLTVTGQKMSVMLSDADAMGPMGGLSGQEEVEVTARVSLTGTANTQPGDWVGEATAISLETKKNEISISIQQP